MAVLSILHWNARGLRNKIGTLELMLAKYKPDVCLISETKLKGSIPLECPGYCVYRDDKISPRGVAYRGLAVLVKLGIRHERLPSLMLASLYELGVTLYIGDTPVRVFALYRAHENKLSVVDLDELLSSEVRTVIAGDWNCWNEAWNSYKTNLNGRTLLDDATAKGYCVRGPPSPTRGSNVLDITVYKHIDTAPAQWVLGILNRTSLLRYSTVMIRVMLAVFLFVTCAAAQNNVGDSCVDQHTNTVGKCAAADRCASAKDDFQKNGINPTFCKYSAFGSPLICCRDGSTILQAAPTANNDGPPALSSIGSDTRRVSERKCEQYSRDVTENVDFIPLLVNPETISISLAKCKYTGVELIVGGENADRGEFPHMAAIGFRNFDGGYNFSCGGSLISPRFVLTAGRCIHNLNAKDPEPVIVRLGDQNIDPSVNDGARPVDVPIKKIHKHPEYKPPMSYNDIALLELYTDVEFVSAIRPACLWSHGGFGEHNKAVATGWGLIDPDTKETAKELQKVSLTLFSNEHCDRMLTSTSYHNWRGLVPSQMCAGELRGGKYTCQGDSGSPLQVASKENQCIFHIIGITSFGKKCAESGLPAVYTRVSSYLDWIEGIVWPGE